MLRIALNGMLVLGVCLPVSLSAACRNDIPATTPVTAFQINQDGTVTDLRNGLVWKRCSEGQVHNNGACNGGAASYDWSQALQRAAAVNAGTAGEGFGHSDWRVPNIKELNGLAESRCSSPAINTTIFPATASAQYWSSSPYVGTASYAWFVDFTFGSRDPDDKTFASRVRLVRDGP